VDEALFLSDRVVMMTSGPNATVGDILTVPFARPRDRAAVMEHPDYDALRNDLVGFLERQGHTPDSDDDHVAPTAVPPTVQSPSLEPAPPKPVHTRPTASRAVALAAPIH
jgi:nitrate/nitrite transport system ATP-binding protein